MLFHSYTCSELNIFTLLKLSKHIIAIVKRVCLLTTIIISLKPFKREARQVYPLVQPILLHKEFL